MSQLSLFEEPTARTGWEPSRRAGLAAMDAYVARSGAQYARQRNFDFGPGRHGNVSTLSPWIRHRAVLETEVLAATLKHHRPETAEKFVQEVFWRLYFKGWLEQNPGVWERYQTCLRKHLADVARGCPEADAYYRALNGQSGIACFDDWIAELRDTGYLHNHARMWFASIWIFTLRLPWELGADLFMRQLLDGDPASNTLSWRWVAGLHTKGKTYLARQSNIAKFTDGRYAVTPGLAATAPALEEPHLPPSVPLPVGGALPEGRFGLLVSEDDGHGESLCDRAPASVLGLSAVQGRSPGAVSDLVTEFSDALMRDSVARAGAHFGVPAEIGTGDWGEALVRWARAHDLTCIVHAHLPVGPARAALEAARPALQAADIRAVSLLRPIDRLVWPHAGKGFFAVKRQIPALLDALKLT